MRRFTFAVAVALVLAGALAAFAQSDVTVSFTVNQGKWDDLKDALQAFANQSTMIGSTPVTVDNAYAQTWVAKQCRSDINAMVSDYLRVQSASGVLDVSGLTRAQRQQVLALIASFK